MLSQPKFNFKDLHPGEQILHIIHRNWFYIFQQFLLMFLAMGIFFVGVFLIPFFFPQFLEGNSRSVVFFVQDFFLLAIWLFGFMIWIDYYYDIWIITSERIINIEQKGMFTRKASELRFQKIQDVTTEVVGFLETIFNYGDVKVQTAGTEEEFIFCTVSDPYAVKNVIMELQKKSESHFREEMQDVIEKIKG
jgi:uncharacterized membrane protein YdbT with pleckstrin-like domain